MAPTRLERWCAAALALALVAGTVGAQEPAPAGPQAWSTLQDEQAGFSIDLPANWVLSNTPLQGQRSDASEGEELPAGVAPGLPAADGKESPLKLLLRASESGRASGTFVPRLILARGTMPGHAPSMLFAQLTAATVRESFNLPAVPTVVPMFTGSGDGAAFEFIVDAAKENPTLPKIRIFWLLLSVGSDAYILSLIAADDEAGAYHRVFVRLCASLHTRSAPSGAGARPALEKTDRNFSSWEWDRWPVGSMGLSMRLAGPAWITTVPAHFGSPPFEAATEAYAFETRHLGFTILHLQTRAEGEARQALLPEMVHTVEASLRAEGVPADRISTHTLSADSAEVRGVPAGAAVPAELRCRILVKEAHIYVVIAEYRTDDDRAARAAEKSLESIKLGTFERKSEGAPRDEGTLVPGYGYRPSPIRR